MAPTDDAGLDDLDPDTRAQFDRYFEHRAEQERKRAERTKPPKDFGDATDRIADAVMERIADALGLDLDGGGDDAPSTGKGARDDKANGVMDWFTGGKKS